MLELSVQRRRWPRGGWRLQAGLALSRRRDERFLCDARSSASYQRRQEDEEDEIVGVEPRWFGLEGSKGWDEGRYVGRASRV